MPHNRRIGALRQRLFRVFRQELTALAGPAYALPLSWRRCLDFVNSAAQQMATEFDRRIERLSTAVARVEEAVGEALHVHGTQSEDTSAHELATIRAENETLRSSHSAVMRRLDSTIARLREVLGE